MIGKIGKMGNMRRGSRRREGVVEEGGDIYLTSMMFQLILIFIGLITKG